MEKLPFVKKGRFFLYLSDPANFYRYPEGFSIRMNYMDYIDFNAIHTGLGKIKLDKSVSFPIDEHEPYIGTLFVDGHPMTFQFFFGANVDIGTIEIGVK